MREIKFRAWDKKEKEMVTNEGFMVSSNGSCYQQKISSSARFTLESVDVELMQYTGLKDKNSKEIYEGDIVWNSGGIKYEILWSYGDSGFICRSPKGVNIGSPHSLENREIIGNIYEYPELLK